MNTLDDVANDSAMLSEASTAHDKQYKTSRYSKLKEDPEAFAIYKEKVRLRNEARKEAIELLKEKGVVVDKPKNKKPVEYKKIDPEVKRRYNTKYYNTHREQINKNGAEYVRNEYAKESSQYVETKRRLARKHYHEVVKKCPDKVERQRERMRIYMRNKIRTPEEIEKHRERARAYKAKKRAEAILKSDSNEESSASTC